jgi:hypothetical protein
MINSRNTMPPVARAFLCLSFVVIALAAQGAGHRIRGMVRDARTLEALPGARVRLVGPNTGTIANRQGRFVMALPDGSHDLSIDLMGYTSVSYHVLLSADTTFDVLLSVNPVQLQSERIYPANAEAIVRQAIREKRNRLAAVHAYQYDAYTRTTLFTTGGMSLNGRGASVSIGVGGGASVSDSALPISTIMETFSTGYWNEGEGTREVIKQRRQTANIDPEGNLTAVFVILNFNDDVQRLAKYQFLGPTAPDALDKYSYELLDVTSLAGKRIYRLRMRPQSRTAALWNGIVSIADSTWEVVEVDVRPNEAFAMPFVDSLRYRQTFTRCDSIHWMPATITIDGSVSVSALLVNLRLRAEHSSVLSNYIVNGVFPPEVFERERIAVDSGAATFDTTYWREHEILPLSPQETEAYAAIDSAVKNTPPDTSKASVLGSILGAPLRLFGAPFTGVDDMYRYNRVEGHRVGLGIDVPWHTWLPTTTLRASMAYGFSAKRTSFDVMLGHRFDFDRHSSLSIALTRFRTLERANEGDYYGTLINTLTSLFSKSDYYDYFAGNGWTVGGTYRARSYTLGAHYLFDEQASIAKTTDDSWGYPSHPFRLNDSIAPGTMRSITLSALLGGRGRGLTPTVQIEMADKGTLGGSFTFTRLAGSVTGRVRVSSTDFMEVRLDAGAGIGSMPPQRLFTANTRSGIVAQFGTMYAMQSREGFSGDRFVSIAMEMPVFNTFGLIDPIPVLAPLGLEVIAHGGAWWSDVSVGAQQLSAVPVTPARQPYLEAGLGLNRIFTFFLVNFTWRITHRLPEGNVMATVTLARF